jgi:hypothetical protein
MAPNDDDDGYKKRMEEWAETVLYFAHAIVH